MTDQCHHQILSGLSPQHAALRERISQVYKGFAQIPWASKQHAAEATGATFLMHGGPATIYGARAYTAFCEFLDAENA